MDLNTYARYVYKRGLSLEELYNSSSLERLFYTASTMYCKDEETKNQIALAKYSNPFLSIK